MHAKGLNPENYLNNRVVNFPVETTIVEEGSPFNGIYYVKKGQLKILKKDKMGKEIMIQLMSQNEFIGLSTYFNDSHYQFSAITQESCKLIYIKPDEFETLLSRSFDIKKQLMIVMIKRLEFLETLIVRLLK